MAMNEGAWINGRTFEFVWITEHTNWLKDAKNREAALKLGIPEEILDKVKGMPNDYGGPKGLREKALLTIMNSGPLIRMRSWVFEFTCSTSDALWGVLIFCQKHAGDNTPIELHNLRTKEATNLSFKEFKAYMDDDERKIIRLAKVIPDKHFSARFLQDHKKVAKNKR